MSDIRAIICATQTEAAPFVPLVRDPHVHHDGMIDYLEGYINSTHVVVTCCGIGKVNAAMATQYLCNQFHPICVINSGCAGALTDSLNVLDLVVGTQYMHHDLDADEMLVRSYPFYPQAAFIASEELLICAREHLSSLAMPVHYVPFVSGETFVDASSRESVSHVFNAQAVDMESAAIAQVCFAHTTNFISVRCITDTPSHDGFEVYLTHARQASEYACMASLTLL